MVFRKYAIIFSLSLLSISFISTSTAFTQESPVPSWVNGVAEFWIEGKITTQEFENCIEYLIKIKVAKDDLIGTLINKISELRYENSQLRAQLWDSTINPKPIPIIKITVQTSQSSYEEGETIVISGNIDDTIEDTPMTIQIFLEGNLVDIAQVGITRDRDFSHTFIGNGPLWQTSGTYTVRAYYGTSTQDTSFDFFTTSTGTKTPFIFEVDAGSYGTFDINYFISEAYVLKMIVDSEQFALKVFLETDDDGSIILELPRESIDAKKSDGSDDAFIVKVDGIEVPYTENSTSVDSRTITIEFEDGVSDIEIIGTFVI